MTSPISDWQATDEGETEIPVRYVPSVKAEPDVPRAERKTAAITGIGVTLLIGALLFGGIGGLLGQLTEPDLKVSIRGNTVDPLELTAQPGQTIQFSNDSGIPQILESETLLDNNGDSFESPVLLPEDTFNWKLPDNTPFDTYIYTSNTNPDIEGTIIVEAAQPQPTATTMSSSSRSSIPVQQTTSSITTTTQVQDEVLEEPTRIPSGSIPVNPHAINGSVTATNTTAIPVAQVAAQTSSQAASVSAHTPVTNTSTGMSAWVLGIVGFLALGLLIRLSAKQW